MPNRSQRSTRTFQTISGQIKTPDFGRSSCLIEISAEGNILSIGNAEARFYLPIEEMQKAMAEMREEG